MYFQVIFQDSVIFTSIYLYNAIVFYMYSKFHETRVPAAAAPTTSLLESLISRTSLVL